MNISHKYLKPELEFELLMERLSRELSGLTSSPDLDSNLGKQALQMVVFQNQIVLSEFPLLSTLISDIPLFLDSQCSQGCPCLDLWVSSQP